MSQSREKQSYNPFTEIGRYNLETYLYKNKRAVLGLTILLLILLFGLGWFFWSEGVRQPKKISRRGAPPPESISPPRYGYGPYGYGLYAPPKAILEEEGSLLQ